MCLVALKCKVGGGGGGGLRCKVWGWGVWVYKMYKV